MLALERQVTPASILLDATAREIHEVGEATVVFDANQAASLMAHAADNFVREIHPTNAIEMVIASSIVPLKYSGGHLALESEIAIEVDVAYPPLVGSDFRTEVFMNSLVGNTREGEITPLRNPDISINAIDHNIYRLAQRDAKTFGDNPDTWIARGIANELAARDIHLEPQDVRLKVTPDGLKVSI